MNDVAPVTATPTDTAPPPSSQEIAPAESIADHAAQFDPALPVEPPQDAKPLVVRARDPKSGQFSDKPRHRAQSQKASAADVPRIAELTKKLRDAERERDEWKAKHSAPPSATRVDVLPPKIDTAQSFPIPKPTVQSLMDAGVEDPYAELPFALMEWRDQVKAHEAAQAQQATDVAASTKALTTRIDAFRAEKPDYDEVMAKGPQDELSPLMWKLVTTDDNGPAFGYYLAQHPDEFDQMLLETLNAPVTPQAVAILQRRLSQRVQAATTGSAALARAVIAAPKPPNPVRTGPIKTDDEPPETVGSIAEHRKWYGKTAR